MMTHSDLFSRSDQQICRNAALAVDQLVESLPGFRHPLLLVFTLLLSKCQYRHKQAEHGESDAGHTNQVEELLAVVGLIRGKSPSRADVSRVRGPELFEVVNVARSG